MKHSFIIVLFFVIQTTFAQITLNEGMNFLFYQDSLHPSLFKIDYILKKENVLIDYSIETFKANDTIMQRLYDKDAISDTFSITKYFKIKKLKSYIYDLSNVKNNYVFKVSLIDTFYVELSKIYKLESGNKTIWLDFNMDEFHDKNESTKVNDSLLRLDYFSWPSLRLDKKVKKGNELYYCFIYDDPNSIDEEYSFIFKKNLWIVKYSYDWNSDMYLTLINNIRFNKNNLESIK